MQPEPDHAIPADLSALWRKQGWWTNRTLGHRFAEAVAAHPDARLEVISDTRPANVTLAQFDRLARSVANGLRAQGIRAGDVVAVQAPGWIEAMATFAGTLHLGAVVTPIVHIYGAAEVAYILDRSCARLLVTPDSFRGNDYRSLLLPVLAERPAVRWAIFGDPGESGAMAFETLARHEPMTGTAVVGAEEMAMLIYTSGTTSAPKGVLHSHQTLGAELDTWASIRDDLSPTLAPWPIGHIAGFLNFLRFAALGTATIFMDKWNGDVAARLIAQRRVRATSGTPLHVGNMLDAAEQLGLDLSSMIDYQAGATTIPSSLIQRCEDQSIHLYRCYGSTEHPSVSIGDPSDPLAKRLTTEGRLAPGVEARLVDDAGRDVPVGEDGEIALRGPDRFVGYQDAALNIEAFLPGGWFLSGDIGRVDSEGYLHVTDRKKDIIIRGGENISSREVEEYLLAHPAVADAAAIGLPDERMGERVCACVVLHDGERLDVDALKCWFAQAGVARQKTPEQLEILAELPRNASGKIVKPDLRQRIAASNG